VMTATLPCNLLMSAAPLVAQFEKKCVCSCDDIVRVIGGSAMPRAREPTI